MPRDPFSASLAWRRRYIRDRWWLVAGVLVAVGGVLVSLVSAAARLLIILGIAVLVFGLTRGVADE
jgi:hypothetical protein